MEIVSHKDIGDEAWDAFCEASPEAWLRHTTRGRHTALGLDSSNEDHSFGVMRDGALIALAPAVTQPLVGTGKREYAFSINTRPTDTHSLPTPAPAAHSMEVFAFCMQEIDRCAQQYGIARTRMCIDPLTQVPTHNPLLAFGYTDASTETYIVRLHKNEKELLARMSKGHRADISFAENQDYDVQIEEDSVGLHARLFHKEKCVAHALAITYKNGAYYGKSQMELEARALRGAGQLLQWRLMHELKRRGFEAYDMGWQSGSSAKDVAIASFKRHFGGERVSLWIGTKYTDLDATICRHLEL